MDKKKLLESVTKVLEEKGKKKFAQSVELIVNFRGINFSKTENRLNLDIPLPKGKGGKEPKIAVIAEEAIGNQAKKANADLVIGPNEIASYGAQEKLKDLANNYVLVCQPNLMGQVAKSLGQYLGPRGKLPKPITGNIVELMDKSKKGVRIVSKGKYLPVAQAFVGTENMDTKDIVENIEAVYDVITGKTTEANIKSVFVKMTMGKPVRVM
ncbi:50S ribosomal protein L1 [Candidatus Micrarchaeota archaeon]|nr:50S ribosomal protein L1 [Candidatus Micrarchaeota archaeon]